MLETVYENDGKAFVEKVTGRGEANAFFRAIPAGDRYLLKLHGNLDNAAERVLNQAEYDAAYGNDGNIHFDSPLPKLLKRLFTSYSFLFLGCSLSADRTVQTFMRVAQLEGQDNLPHHYALLPCPTDAHETPGYRPAPCRRPHHAALVSRRASMSTSSRFLSCCWTDMYRTPPGSIVMIVSGLDN